MRISFAIALVAAATGVAAAQQGQPHQQTQQSTAPRANQSITVTGCVAAGANNTYTLTVAPDDKNREPVTGSTATTPAGSKVTKTVTYTLTGSKQNDLKAHLGHTVQVTGVEAAPEMTTKTQGTTGTSGASGASGAKGTPKVQVTEQTQIVTRQLTVNSVKMVASTCDLVK